MTLRNVYAFCLFRMHRPSAEMITRYHPTVYLGVQVTCYVLFWAIPIESSICIYTIPLHDQLPACLCLKARCDKCNIVTSACDARNEYNNYLEAFILICYFFSSLSCSPNQRGHSYRRVWQNRSCQETARWRDTSQPWELCGIHATVRLQWGPLLRDGPHGSPRHRHDCQIWQEG